MFIGWTPTDVSNFLQAVGVVIGAVTALVLAFKNVQAKIDANTAVTNATHAAVTELVAAKPAAPPTVIVNVPAHPAPTITEPALAPAQPGAPPEHVLLPAEQPPGEPIGETLPLP